MDFALQTNGPYERVLEAARWAEQHDMVALALPDHYLASLGDSKEPAWDNFAHLAGLARETAVIELAILVSPITFRHPAVLLKLAVTIDHMSGGRFALGVGAGWLQREHEVFGIPYPETSERFERLEEALAYLRAGLDPAATGYEGRFFRLEATEVAPMPIGQIRLAVGGVGERRTPSLAGQYADEYNVFPGTAQHVSARLGRARAAAHAAGRDFDEILLSSSGQVLAAPTEAQYREKLAAMAERINLDVEEIEAHYEHRNTPRGSYEQVADQIGLLSTFGISRFYLQWAADFNRSESEELVAYLRRAIG